MQGRAIKFTIIYGKFLLVAMLVLCLFFFSGCWSRNEVEDLAILTGGCLDYVTENGQPMYKGVWLILKAPNGETSGSSGSSSQSPADITLQGEGETFQDALNDMDKQIPRKPIYTHHLFMIFGESIAREGLVKITEDFLRYPEVRPNGYQFVTRGKAAPFLEAKPLTVSNLYVQAKKQQAIAHITGVSRGVTSQEFCQWLLSPDRDPVLPQMKWNEKSQINSLIIEGFGVFRSDKLVGWLEKDEATGYLLLTENLKNIRIPLKFEFDNQIMSYYMGGSKYKIKAEMVKGRLYFQITVQTFGVFAENNNLHITAQNVGSIEAAVGEKIKYLTLKTIAKTQELDSDCLGLMQYLHRHNPSAWREIKSDWRKAFREAEITVEIQPKIVSEGALKQSFDLKN
ncbi:Ger(x)C family spore germination protein [Dehalobacter sp. DCM]|uniref:Ger(x)C family spore germination protein n=1 Tax=Dehalobacter sp. DCM TaxID=2907827 RepID=UPI003081FF57|nr:Ger(x)C family spore germination protein [Dehalobacter sp. DCM]